MAALIILVLFVGLPVAEILTFIEVGGRIGAWTTIAAVIATAAAGAVLFRVQGMNALTSAKQDLDQGRMPLENMLGGVGLLLAALFLFVPGFITDAIGFLLFIPPIRVMVLALLVRNLMMRGNIHVSMGDDDIPGGFADRQGGSDVIDGEFEDVTRDPEELPGPKNVGSNRRPDNEPDNEKDPNR